MAGQRQGERSRGKHAGGGAGEGEQQDPDARAGERGGRRDGATQPARHTPQRHHRHRAQLVPRAFVRDVTGGLALGRRRVHQSRRQPPAGLQHDFAARGEIAPELVRQLARQRLALGREVELVVREQARHVQVARADAGPAAIHQHRLRVDHRTLVLEHAHAGAEQVAIADPREIAQDGEVTRAGHEQPHVHAAPRRVDQTGVQRRGRDQVGVGDPQPLGGARGEQLHGAVYAGPAGHALHHAHDGAAARRRIGRELVGRERRPGAAPDAGEGAVQRRGGRPGDGDHRIAPRPAPAGGIPRPLVADAETADHRPPAVGGEQLAVVALRQLEGARREQRMKRPHLDARLPQPAPEAMRRADRTERVVQHAHPHARARPLGERVREATARRVVADDVILEVDGGTGRGDGGDHGIEGPGAVGVMLQVVPADRPGTGRPVDRPAQLGRRRDPIDLILGRRHPG